ncbi:MAG: retropepsin-like aspartic protease [Smithella sp.]
MKALLYSLLLSCALNFASAYCDEVPLLAVTDKSLLVHGTMNDTVIGTFIIDTGSVYTVITPEMASKLGVDMVHAKTTTIMTVNGVKTVPLVTIPSIKLGFNEVKNSKAIITSLGDDPVLAGLLGMSFFDEFEFSISGKKLNLKAKGK